MTHPATNGPTIDALSRLLATTYVLAFKTHGYHWNVVGPTFYQLHEMFGGQYAALYAAADDLAERIRALGFKAPADYATYAGLSAVQADGSAPAAPDMIEALRDGHRAAAAAARAVVDAAEASGDSATADMAIGRIEAHDKAAWMLGALLG